MPLLLSAWPAVVLLLPALVLVSALVFLARRDRRAFAHLMALVACFLISALLMEFFTFMGALMARAGGPQATPELGTGTRQLLDTLANPRSVTAPPLSLAAMAAYGIGVSYLWLLITWVLHLRGGKRGAAPKKSGRSPRKTAKA